MTGNWQVAHLKWNGNETHLLILELGQVSTHVCLQHDAAGLHLLELAAVMPAANCLLHQNQLLRQHLISSLLKVCILCILPTQAAVQSATIIKSTEQQSNRE